MSPCGFLSVQMGPIYLFSQTSLQLPAFPASTNRFFSSSLRSFPTSIRAEFTNFTECIAASPGRRTNALGLNSRSCRSFSLPPLPGVMSLVVRHKCNSILMTQTPHRLTRINPMTRRTSTLLCAPPLPPLPEEAPNGVHSISRSSLLRILMSPPSPQVHLFQSSNLFLAMVDLPSPSTQKTFGRCCPPMKTMSLLQTPTSLRLTLRLPLNTPLCPLVPIIHLLEIARLSRRTASLTILFLWRAPPPPNPSRH